MTTPNRTEPGQPRNAQPPALIAKPEADAQAALKTYRALLAQDVAHYGFLEVEAADPADAVARTRVRAADEIHEITNDPDWSSPVCRRIVHIEDGTGATVAEAIALDGYVLHHSSERRALLCASAERLLGALQQIAAMPLWGEPIADAGLRDELIFSGEYDVGLDEYLPGGDTESDALRDAVETARQALAGLASAGLAR